MLLFIGMEQEPKNTKTAQDIRRSNPRDSLSETRVPRIERLYRSRHRGFTSSSLVFLRRVPHSCA